MAQKGQKTKEGQSITSPFYVARLFINMLCMLVW